MLAEVARVLRDHGLYRLHFTNPFVHGEWEDGWTGRTYALSGPYLDAEVPSKEPWTIRSEDGTERQLPGPREFRHTLGTIVNGLVGEGLQILGLWEDALGDPGAAPGTWEHFKTHGAPWITIVSRRQPRP